MIPVVLTLPDEEMNTSRSLFTMDEDLQSVSSGSLRSPSYSISDLSETEGFVVQELATSASRSFGGSSNLLAHNGEDESNFRVGGGAF